MCDIVQFEASLLCLYLHCNIIVWFIPFIFAVSNFRLVFRFWPSSLLTWFGKVWMVLWSVYNHIWFWFSRKCTDVQTANANADWFRLSQFPFSNKGWWLLVALNGEYFRKYVFVNGLVVHILYKDILWRD